MIGKSLGPYEIESLLGTGGMGEVYRALDTRLQRRVAIKILNERIAGSAEARKRLVREARSLAALHHPGIATLFGFESIEGFEMLVMELVEGVPLSTLLRDGPMDPDRARDLLVRICEALAVAHDRGIIHRDLKPDNLMILPGDEVKILDFGLAVGADDTRITREGSTFGTASYMSPEQARGEVVDARSDVFSLGVVAAELLSGSRLFDGESVVAVVRQIADLREAPTVNSAPDLTAFVERCMHPGPGERPADAGAALTLIAPAAGESQSPPSSRRSSPLRWVAIMALVLVAGVFGGTIWSRGSLRTVPDPVVGDALAVVPFQNLNLGEDQAWFATASAELLATKMSGSAIVDVISPERVRMILEAAGADSWTALSDAGVAFSITGSVVSGPEGLRVETRLVENASGELRHSAVGQAGDEGGLYEVVETLERSYLDFFEVKSISERLEEGWIQKLPTHSVEAYRAFARGREQLSAARWDPAIGFFLEAVTLDSTFVSAWVDLSSCYWNTGDLDQMYATLARAQGLRERASPRERTWLDLYAAVVEGDGPLIVQYAHEMLEREPEHRFVRYLLGKGYYEQEDWNRAVQEWEPLRAEGWSWIWTYLYSSRAWSRLGRFDEARVALDGLEGIIVPTDTYARVRLHRYRGLIWLDERDVEAAQTEFDRAQSIGSGYSEYEYDAARAMILSGRLAEARALLRGYISDPEEKGYVSEATTLLEGLE